MFGRRGSPSAPTHGWLIGNRIIRKLAWGFIIIIMLAGLWISMVTYAIRRDCQQVYNRDLKVFGYWIHIEAGSTKENCPQP